MTYTPQPSTAELAHRLGANAHCCEVVSTLQVAPCVREVVLRGNAETLAGRPGSDVMIRVETPEGRFVRRRFSVRAVNAEADALTLWITTDHDGPAAAWATSVIAGDHVDVIGPRGKVFLAEADWHLFVGDLTGLAAFSRLAESIEPPGRATLVAVLDHPEDALTTAHAEGVAITGVFVERRDARADDPAPLLNALAAFAMPPGVGHAYVTGEFSVVKALRAALADRGLADEEIDHKSYWRAGRSNADHGEPDKAED
ncbi:MAG: siderophore-interacting protein [Acidobacteriota bacterium]|nr:siderophore-interacting protein [Acidobacteriota bacterium]